MLTNQRLIHTSALLTLLLSGCGGTAIPTSSSETSSSLTTSSSSEITISSAASSSTVISSSSALSSASSSSELTSSSAANSSEAAADISILALTGSMLDTPDTVEMCTNRDMRQTADITEAQTITLTSGADTAITAEGVYIVSGTVTNATIIVEVADEDAKVQLVLDNLSIINQDAPAIYVKAADKVFVTTLGSNHLEVTGTYLPDGETNLDAVIFSRDDLVINGTGRLDVISAQGNGVSSKDDLKVTGSVISITSALDSLEANDSIRICGGDTTIDTQKDALHSENDDDDSLGYIFIGAGALNINATDDAIRGTSVVQVDGGTINVTTSYEGIEATYIQINDGFIDIYSRDDGINAAKKSSAYNVAIEVNGGTTNVEVGSGDTDAFDSNDAIYINGGFINVIGSSAFDSDGVKQFNGGTVTVNGAIVTTLPGMGGR